MNDENPLAELAETIADLREQVAPIAASHDAAAAALEAAAATLEPTVAAIAALKVSALDSDVGRLQAQIGERSEKIAGDVFRLVDTLGELSRAQEGMSERHEAEVEKLRTAIAAYRSWADNVEGEFRQLEQETREKLAQIAKEARQLNPSGEWTRGAIYSKLDVVLYKGSSFVSKADNNTDRPGKSPKWQLMAKRGASGGSAPAVIGGEVSVATLTASGAISAGGNATITGTLALGGGSAVSSFRTATAALNFPAIVAGDSADLTVTVTGAQVGDAAFALPAAGGFLGNLSFECCVTATNTVTVRCCNFSNGDIDPGATTVRVVVIRF